MNTKFLEDLGITDKAIINAIFAENGKDVNAAKAELDVLKTQVTDLQGQVTERDKQLTELKKSVTNNEELTKKIGELEAANESANSEYQKKIVEIQKSHAIENGVRDAKAKNVKAVMALLDMEKITFKDNQISGLNEQLDALQKDESSNFLFISEQKTPPAGTNPSNPPSNGGGNPPTSKSLSEAVAKALTSNK